MTYDLGFIGTGNMGSALARAAAKTVDPARMLLCNRTREKADALAKALNCASGDSETAARESRFIVLGVKPQGMAALLDSLAPILKARTDRFCLVTMAAGLTAARIAELAGGDYPVIRIMPNTPVLVGAGVTLYCKSPEVEQAELEVLLDALQGAGLLDEISEGLLNAGAALAGSGTAFASILIEAMADGAVACGLARDKAMEYAAWVLTGMGKLYLSTHDHPGAMKDAICSPGGSTIAGVRALERGGFRAAAMLAVEETYKRNNELG